MNIKEVTKFIDSIHNNDLENILIKKKYTKITVNRIKTHQRKSVKYLKKINVREEIVQNQKEHNKPDHTSTYSMIISPMVGTFYQSPAPNEPSFVEIGEIVKPKQTVCIIEAMKLMNEIESEINGEIVEILVKNGDIVDCGQALIKIKIK